MDFYKNDSYLKHFRRLVLAITFVSSMTMRGQGIVVPNQIIVDDLNVNFTEDAKIELEKIIQGLNKNAKYFQSKLEKMDLYFPIIERILLEQGVPDDFKYLCVMESGLEANAVSTSNAVGFWQFKKESAIEVGMRIDHEVDERKNIVSSSIGACKYLKRSNLALNNWIYTTLSYNLGLGGTKRIMENQYVGVKEMTLDGSTHRYILKFLAYKILFSGYIHKNARTITLLEYVDGGGKTLNQIADLIKIDREILNSYNTWLIAHHLPKDKPYTVVIPSSFAEKDNIISVLGLDIIVQSPSLEVRTETKRHWWEIFKDKNTDGAINSTDVPVIIKNNGLKAIQAKKGDNSQKLAIQGDVKFKRFLKYNEIRSFDEIIPGKFYYLERKMSAAHVLYHIVQMNERIWDISQMYGITIESILEKNKMEEGEALVAGRKLYLKYERPEGELVIIEKLLEPELPIKVVEKTVVERDTIYVPIKVESKDSVLVSKSNYSDYSEPVKDKSPKLIDTTNFVKHLCTPGQSLYAISKIYQTSVDSIKIWNNLDSLSIKFGQSLWLKKKTLVPSQVVDFNSEGNDIWVFHTVVAGESMYKIAKLYGVSVAEIQTLNDKLDFKVSIGEQLKIKKK